MARQQTAMQLSSGEMANDAQIVIRVPQAMAERLKAYADELSGEIGVPVSVAAATRKLLGDALETVGHGAPASESKGRAKPKR